MESKRQLKFAKLIQKDLGDIFQKEMPGLANGSLITVTIVRMTPDLGEAKIYLSIFPETKREQVLEKVNEQKSAIRNLLGRRIKNQVRKIPVLDFFSDDTQEEVDKINKLFKEIDIPPADEENKED